MNEQKLVVVIMGQNCEKFIGMALESVKDADAIVYCDGGSTDNTLSIVNGNIPMHQVRDIIHNPYNQEDKTMNGKQRNFYLDYVKKNYPGWWCLALDADEVVEDLDKIKKWINKYNDISDMCPYVGVKMRHFIGDLGHEDSTVQEHFVPHRLFKVVDNLYYPLGEHPILLCTDKADRGYVCRDTTIWHLAYCPNMWDIKRRYDNHMKKSEIHTPQYLHDWYYSHLFGTYPKKQIDILDIPAVILKEFGIDKDELYFMNRGIEAKHFILSRQWLDHFNPKSVIEFGCGRAPYGYAIKSYNVEYDGIELSKFAVNTAFVPILQGDIASTSTKKQYDLVLAVDVLEHLDDEKLNQAMLNIMQHGDTFLFSVPVVGDPNLMNDKTHKQFKTKEEWIELWESYGIKITETPQNWLFKDQIFIGTRK